MTYTGQVVSFSVSLASGFTGHMTAALYDNTGVSGSPGALLCTSAQATNPAAGINILTVSSGPTVTKGALYYFAIEVDAAATLTATTNSLASGSYSQTFTYNTTLPNPAVPVVVTFTALPNSGPNITPQNWSTVTEATHDDLTSYVYDSTVGHTEFYNVASLVGVPVVVTAVQTRAYAQKSDAGARTLGIQMKSGTIVSSASLALSTTIQQITRVDPLDPNTGVAWTASGVNAITVGPSLVA